MNRGRPVALLVAVAAATLALADTRAEAAPQDPSLAGRWVLNRALSQFPREVGFGMDVIPPGTGDRAGSDALAAAALGNNPRPVSEFDARNTAELVAEVKNPPNFFEITQTAATVTLVDGRGRTRTFHTDGRDEFVTLQAGPVTTIARWDGPKLVVRYKVQPERELRYTLLRNATPAQLIVQVQFVERGGRDVITRIYEPAKPGAPIPPEPDLPVQPQRPAWQQAPAAPAQAAQPPTGAGTGTPPPAAQGDRPRLYQPGQPLPPSPQDQPASPDRAAGRPLDQRPGAEFKGLTSLGVVIEDLGSTATSCGLRKEVLESTVTKSLTDAGLKVVTNTDEDTYLYVRVMTSALSTGFCFSRYDAMLYTHTTAALTYGSAPALVQVELLRNGGLAGGGGAAHADSVVRNLKQYVDAFAARIRDANK